ncbi:MAG: glycosyltransferase [Elusimicrobiaceae bacterium]
MNRIWAITIGALLMAFSFLAYFNVYFMDFSFQAGFVRTSFIVLLSFMIVLILRYFLLIYFSSLNFLLPHPKRELTEFPLVSILLPAFNEGVGIENAIKSALGQNYPNIEVIVIDDGSSDNTIAQASRYSGFHGNGKLTIITQPNQGKATALNNGIAASHGQFILCMDGDSLLDPNVLKEIIPRFDNPKIGAVAGNVKVANRHKTLTKLQALEYIEGLNMVKRAQSFFQTVNIIPGPLGVFRRTAIVGVGGYDHDTFAEDCDLTIKLLRAGWKVEYEPDAISWTEAPEKVIPLLTQRYRWTRGILQSLKKHSAMLFKNSVWDRTSLVLWYMLFEALFWPAINIFTQFFFVYVACTTEMVRMVIFWWLQLTLLDMMAALLCVTLEGESLVFVPYAILYRFYFVVLIDVCKFFATLEELFHVKMIWGQLERKGARRSG